MKFLQLITNNVTLQRRIIPLVICLTLLLSILIIAITPPAKGYELSIYDAYPAILWILISINIFFSIFTIIQSCDSFSKNVYCGYFSLILIESIILLLPMFRGYYSMSRGGGDIFHHMFVASQISNTGYVQPSDIYPMMHILSSILDNFFYDFILTSRFISLFCFIFYILSLYVLGKTLLGSVRGGIFISIFGIPLIFSYGHYAFYPFLFAIFMIPLILYVYQKIISTSKQQNVFFIILLCLSFFIVFCHSMIAIFLIILFSFFYFYALIKGGIRLKNIMTNVIAIVLITVFVWIFNFQYLINTLHMVASDLFGEGTHQSILEYQMNVVTTSNASIWLVIDRFIKIYGPICLYFLISLMFITFIIYQYYQNKKIIENDLFYSIQFCIAICIGIVLLTGFFVIFEPIRAAMYGLVFATIINGLFFYRIWPLILSERGKLGFTYSIALLITIVCILTMLTIYSSPWVSGTNSALSNGDKKGIDWILEYQNEGIPIVKEDETMNPYKTYYESVNNKNSRKLIEYPRSIPSNYGYNTSRTIANSFRYLPYNEVYMLTNELMKLKPLAVPVERRGLLKTFTDSDFVSLMNDQTVNLIYSGNEFSVWHINLQ